MEENKLCCNCKYMLIGMTEEHCKSCRCKSNWVAREEKMCDNCKYASVSCYEDPCRECYGRSNWVDASKPDKLFKAGDIVIAKNDRMSVRNIYIYLGDNWVLHIPRYVVVRSKCDYCFSNYTNELISANIALHICNLDYASPKDITEHDCRANTYYISETLNDWFSQLIKKESEKKEWAIKDPGLGYKDYGSRYDKFPTFNRNFIKKVIFNDPATIVFWEDGTKTVVKTQDGEKYDKEKGLSMAISKKILGNERDYYNVFKRWMRKGEERHEQR